MSSWWAARPPNTSPTGESAAGVPLFHRPVPCLTTTQARRTRELASLLKYECVGYAAPGRNTMPLAVLKTKCDTIRLGIKSAASADCLRPPPFTPPMECSILDIATKRDMQIFNQRAPQNLTSTTAKATSALLKKDVAIKVAALKSRYGKDAPVDFMWRDVPQCLWDPVSGAPAGQDNQPYITRNDMAGLNYKPHPYFGGETLKGRMPDALVAAVPVWADRYLNPDLAGLFIFVVAVILLMGLMYWASVRRAKIPARALAARIAKLKKFRTATRADPQANTKKLDRDIADLEDIRKYVKVGVVTPAVNRGLAKYHLPLMPVTGGQ